MIWRPSSPPGIWDPTAHPHVTYDVGLWCYFTVGLWRGGSYPLYEPSPPHGCGGRCERPRVPGHQPQTHQLCTHKRVLVANRLRQTYFNNANRMRNISELQNKIGKLYFYSESKKNPSLKTTIILRKDSLFDYEYF